MAKLVMDEDLREHKLLAILDILLEADDKPLSITKIQYRLGANRNLTMSRDEIEAHLHWGQNQPNASQAPVRPVQVLGDWIVEAKVPLTLEEHKAAGPPPWL